MDSRNLRDLIHDRIQNRTPGDRGFEIRNATGDAPAELRIYDVIGWPYLEASAIVAALDEITADELVVSINSPGGDVTEGIAIYNALRQHKAHVTTRVDSLAASIASVIAQAGDHRVMLTASQMVIHNAWSMAMGDGPYLRTVAEILERQDAIISNVYASRSGKPQSHFLELMADETWMDDTETLDNGLADEIVDPPRQTKTDSSNRKYSDQLAAAVAVVEEVTDRTEGVAAFRDEQGKPPLAPDSVEAVEALIARLTDVITPEEAPETETVNSTDLEQEYLRFQESRMVAAIGD